MPMLTTQALRADHIRTAGQAHRACPCCITLRPGDTRKIRRTQRRRDRQAFRTNPEQF